MTYHVVRRIDDQKYYQGSNLWTADQKDSYRFSDEEALRWALKYADIPYPTEIIMVLDHIPVMYRMGDGNIGECDESQTITNALRRILENEDKGTEVVIKYPTGYPVTYWMKCD